MPISNEVAPVEECSTTNDSSNNNHQKQQQASVSASPLADFTNIEKYDDHHQPYCPRAQHVSPHQNNESKLRNRGAMSSLVDSNQKQQTLNCSKDPLQTTGNCSDHPMGTSSAQANNQSSVTSKTAAAVPIGLKTIENNANTSFDSVSGTIQQSNDSSEAHQQQQQQLPEIQRLSNNISNNNKIVRNINGGGRLNGCCCPLRRSPPSSLSKMTTATTSTTTTPTTMTTKTATTTAATAAKECVDDDQADNYCQRSKNNNNNIKMTITLTTTARKRNDSGPQTTTTTTTTTTLPSSSVTTAGAPTVHSLGAPITTLTSALTTATTTSATESASTAPASVTTTSTTAAYNTPTTTTTSKTTTMAIAPSAKSALSPNSTIKSAQRIMIGCGSNDNSNESDDANRLECKINATTTTTTTTKSATATTQQELPKNQCNDSTDKDSNVESNRKCNDECNNDKTMTSSAINTPSMQSPSLSSTPFPSSSSSLLCSSTTSTPLATATSAKTKATTKTSQVKEKATSQQPTTAATKTKTTTTTSPSSSSSSSKGHEVLTRLGDKFGFQATASGGSGSGSLSGSSGGFIGNAITSSNSTTSSSSSCYSSSKPTIVAATPRIGSVSIAVCNGAIVNRDTLTNMTRNMNLSAKDRMCLSQEKDSMEKCDKNSSSYFPSSFPPSSSSSSSSTSSSTSTLSVASSTTNDKNKLNFITLDELNDSEEDPYNVLQEYLERVKTEINEVFEQYKQSKQPQNDISTRCTDADIAEAAKAADVVNQMVADNKLPSNEMSCRLNGTTTDSDRNNCNSISSNMKVNESSSSSCCDTNGFSSSSNSGRYLTVPVVPSEYHQTSSSSSSSSSAPATPSPSAIMSTNTFPSLNHGNDQTEATPSSTANSRASTLKRLNSQNAPSSCSPAEYLQQSHDPSDDVNIWANKFLRDLDNLMGSDKWSAVAAESAASSSSIGNGGSSVVTTATSALLPSMKISIPRPEKHVTIPLQSFNLDCRPLDVSVNAAATAKLLNPSGIYLRTLSAPNANDSNHSPVSTNNNHNNCRLLPKNTPGSRTVLKIEETDAMAAEERRRRKFESDMETMQSATATPPASNQSQVVASPATSSATVIQQQHQPKRERVTLAPNSNGGGYQLQHHSNSNNQNNNNSNNNDATKKGSTSTIWTSEESILRSVGAADEDNNSTSSSACEEASGVLSSGKSGLSLDSSGLDNDNNESGIGTATPPKDSGFWKNTTDNDSMTSSLDALRKIKFQKGSSVASSDDPDLLEVLSLYDETHDDDADDIGIHHDHEHDHENEEFETGTFDGYDSGSGKGVVLRRRKSNLQINDSHGGSKDSAIHLLPYLPPPPPRAPKSRSHSLEVASPLPMPMPLRHELKAKDYRDKGRLCLALRQEPFQSIIPSNFHELPSPSSASLHSGHESLGMQELTTKSNSAPLLLKKERKRDDFGGQKQTLRYSRSQSDRYLAEIEAVEACKWLRAAGFPQYAQMYEDHQFPIDLTNVAKDHTNLENDPLQSLYRRLCILNRCANMRLDNNHKSHTPQKEDSDDENCALSENWTFQPHIRRWSRIGEMGLELPTKLTSQDKNESSSKESSPDRFEDDDTYDIAGETLNLSMPNENEQADGTAPNDSDSSAVRLRRTGSERLKDGAKAFLRRVESIKSRRRKRQNREGIVISGPQALDLSQLGQRVVRKPDAVYSTPPSPSAVSPMHMYPKSPLFHHHHHHLNQHDLKVPSQSENFLSPNRIASPKRTPTTPRSMRTSPLHFFGAPPMPHLREGKSDDSSSYYSDSQESSSTGGGKLTLSLRKAPSKSRRFLQRTGKVDDIGTHSDSECHQGRKFVFKDSNSNTTEMKVKKLTRGGSLNLGKDSKKRDGFRSASFRTRSTVRKDHKTSESDTENVKIVSKSPVVRWHSFQEEERPHMIFKKCFTRKVETEKTEGTSFAAMSCGQLQIIRKLALAILTGYMERYCPTHRSGWNWELPKFIKKIKMPDYKDKKVFGVPLLLTLQRTGQTLPMPVRAAFRWLQLNALDQIGLFRKSGVKSRIFKLKERVEVAETSAECMDVFDTQQAYDVADMVKQYFRDLPESLLTTKMSETFAAIFQHLPLDVRLDAVQCAVLLLPDENREILYALLEFLTLVADNSQYNQMTANNLAVCLAPSLFHNSLSMGSTSVAASPRRKKNAGIPDAKELSEAKASHECLSFMIDNYRQIFTASRERISKCNFGYMEESKPVPLEALGEGMQFHNWRGYLYECANATIKEGREKSRGWFSTGSLDPNVDIAYKKVGDGHPLRLWRCTTEVEGPPREVLEYVLKQRASWDVNLLQSQTIKKLDERTEIFQYVFDGQIWTDFCVLRSWQTDLPRGACVIVETSIDHPKAKSVFGSVRGVVLASRYLIEPCGSGRSRVMHLARVDIKGKTPEWYNKSYGHICSHYLSKIKLAFRHISEGPESKV
ncbi:serine-rich adhesin for platelets [Eupeodes corollae]|uniref:serine-rich adhesin for platelets n=1 Tax=Eupeodes corollae TaxID=290404 RepID=UPI00248FFF6A|nr:serine-rich adhesin for platelets [Eupeodes corollae]